jgi:hypothetical protein
MIAKNKLLYMLRITLQQIIPDKPGLPDIQNIYFQAPSATFYFNPSLP